MNYDIKVLFFRKIEKLSVLEMRSVILQQTIKIKIN